MLTSFANSSTHSPSPLSLYSYRELNIEPFIVLDGLTPKFFVEEDKILEKSFRVWDKAAITFENKELNDEILRRFGVRFY